ncbi:hypothetical protein BaRGS_00033304 [Batillaria attramentaria]|uniref:Uncharacterized protein n=1 Tax=Batillaria attramentaria TaxID=370345 RepID=A0ABD0JL33_9CAEN
MGKMTGSGIVEKDDILDFLCGASRDSSSNGVPPSVATCVRFDDSGRPSARTTSSMFECLQSEDEDGQVNNAANGPPRFVGTVSRDPARLCLCLAVSLSHYRIRKSSLMGVAPVRSLNFNLFPPVLAALSLTTLSR